MSKNEILSFIKLHASLGKGELSRLLNIDEEKIYGLAWRNSIKLGKKTIKPNEEKLQKIAMYMRENPELTRDAIAKKMGTSYDIVRRLSAKLDITVARSRRYSRRPKKEEHHPNGIFNVEARGNWLI